MEAADGDVTVASELLQCDEAELLEFIGKKEKLAQKYSLVPIPEEKKLAGQFVALSRQSELDRQIRSGDAEQFGTEALSLNASADAIENARKHQYFFAANYRAALDALSGGAFVNAAMLNQVLSRIHDSMNKKLNENPDYFADRSSRVLVRNVTEITGSVRAMADTVRQTAEGRKKLVPNEVSEKERRKPRFNRLQRPSVAPSVALQVNVQQANGTTNPNAG